ncbi:hypothetical protein [Flavobacterium sp.]|uniref:hypothetical protein n=1 Tax=Flavobacterium sp. TaxID=239 RepID=UPI0026115044|nr:hypothetical protein [Flavobacterium sp.]MDD3004194.1 hypothetical protein [Flavobacterium sp.]
MNQKLKRFFIILAIASIVNFTLFYFIEEDRSCVFEWGSKCSNSFLMRSTIQVLVLTLFLFFFSKPAKPDKQ